MKNIGLAAVSLFCETRQGEDSHHACEEVVAEALSTLGQGVRGQGRNHEAVSPPPQLYMQHRVPYLLPLPPLLLITCSALVSTAAKASEVAKSGLGNVQRELRSP